MGTECCFWTCFEYRLTASGPGCMRDYTDSVSAVFYRFLVEGRNPGSTDSYENVVAVVSNDVTTIRPAEQTRGYFLTAVTCLLKTFLSSVCVSFLLILFINLLYILIYVYIHIYMGMVKYTPEQCVFMYSSYMKEKSYKLCKRRFHRKCLTRGAGRL
jgi:hypothetical protein